MEAPVLIDGDSRFDQMKSGGQQHSVLRRLGRSGRKEVLSPIVSPAHIKTKRSTRIGLCAVLLALVCSGCLLRLEHNTTSPGGRGIVLDAQTHAPLSGAEVVISRVADMQAPKVSDALTNTRPPVVTTRANGRFSIRPERQWDLVYYLTERFRRPGGTLVAQHPGYEPAVVPLWGAIRPVTAHSTNFVEVSLTPLPPYEN